MKRLLSAFMALLLLANTLLLFACSTKTTTETTSSGGDPMTSTIDKTATIYDMRTEDMRDPVGLDDPTPTFSWKTASNTRGWAQSAYPGFKRIIFAPEPDKRLASASLPTIPLTA